MSETIFLIYSSHTTQTSIMLLNTYTTYNHSYHSVMSQHYM